MKYKLLLITSALVSNLYAVTAISSITTTVVQGTAASGISYNGGAITADFNGDEYFIDTITAGGTTYNPFGGLAFQSFTDNPVNTSLGGFVTYTQETGTAGDYVGSEVVTFADVFEVGRIDVGSDGTFRSVDDVTFSLANTLTINNSAALTGAGFVLFDRGSGDNGISINGVNVADDWGSDVRPDIGGFTRRVRAQSSDFDTAGPFTEVSRLDQSVIGQFISLQDLGFGINDDISTFTLTEATGGLDLQGIEFVFDDSLDASTAFTVVPEPSSTALLGLGGLALIARRKRA